MITAVARNVSDVPSIYTLDKKNQCQKPYLYFTNHHEGSSAKYKLKNSSYLNSCVYKGFIGVRDSWSLLANACRGFADPKYASQEF